MKHRSMKEPSFLYMVVMSVRSKQNLWLGWLQKLWSTNKCLLRIHFFLTADLYQVSSLVYQVTLKGSNNLAMKGGGLSSALPRDINDRTWALLHVQNVLCHRAMITIFVPKVFVLCDGGCPLVLD